MENRSDVIREYFDLIVHLNKANSRKNKKTEIAFEIRKSTDAEEFGCYLKGLENPIFLVLCNTNINGFWSSANNTTFTFLEYYCEELLKLNGHLAVEMISENLRSLGLKK